MNKKKKSTNTSPYPDEAIERLARAFYPAILACWNSEEGQREFAAWQAEQAHHTTSKEKQSVPDGERPVVHIAIVCGLWQGASGCWVFVKQFSRNDTATACQDWLRSTRPHLLTVASVSPVFAAITRCVSPLRNRRHA